MNDLDPIPDPDLAFLVEAAPVPDDGAATARARGTHLRRRRVVGAVAAGVCAVLVLTGLTFVARGARGTASTADHRPPSVPHVDPPLPKGWRHVDWGDLRFAVPGDWTVQTGMVCPGAGVDVALGAGEMDLLMCVKLPDDRKLFVNAAPLRPLRCESAARLNGVIVTQDGDCLSAPQPPGPRPTVGAFDPWTCSDDSTQRTVGCTLRVLGWEMRFGAVDPAVQRGVIRSITTSPAYRAVHDGPTLDTRHWRTVTGAGVTMKVPPSWRTERLPPTTDYGFCPDGPTPHRAVVGGRPAVPSCPAPAQYRPWGNSTWTRRPAGTDIDTIGSAVPHRLSVNGHRLVRISGGGPVDPYPRLTLLVGSRRRPAVVTLSIGGDPDVSRTILTTIRPSR